MHYFGKIVSLSLAALPLAAAAPIRPAVDAENVIPGAYIVVMNDDVASTTFNDHRNWVANYRQGGIANNVRGGEFGLKHTYDFGALKGYSGIFDEDTIKSIANTPDVSYIEILRVNPVTNQFAGCIH